MIPSLRRLFADVGALAVIAAALLFLFYLLPEAVSRDSHAVAPAQNPSVSAAAAGASLASSTAAASTPETPPPPAASPTSAPEKKPPPAANATVSAADPAPQAAAETPAKNTAQRLSNPYASPPLSFDTVNGMSRAALVNILCVPRNGSFSSISGSGVIIDPRGVILTNAHVAQYVLLAQSGRVDLSCVIRSGSPAIARWQARVLYLPPAWVEAHASDITASRPSGTGEHDYALLLITGSVTDSPLPTAFSYLSPDTREAVAFEGDEVLVATYPAEFLGGYAAQYSLYPAASITQIGRLMTFVFKTVDLISLGGIIEAQSGSSGGAVTNAWGRLVGLVSTTSDGATTASRDLRAITLSYITRDLAAQTGSDLETMLRGDVAAETREFSIHSAPALVEKFLSQLSH